MTKEYLGVLSIGKIEVGKKIAFNNETNIDSLMLGINEAVKDLEKESLGVLKEYLEEDAKTISDLILKRDVYLLPTIEFFANNQKYLEGFLPEGLVLKNNPEEDAEEIAAQLKNTDLLYQILLDLTWNPIERIDLSFKEADVSETITTYLENPTAKPLQFNLHHEILMKNGAKGYELMTQVKGELITFISRLDKKTSFFLALYNSSLNDRTLSREGLLTILPNNEVIVVK